LHDYAKSCKHGVNEAIFDQKLVLGTTYMQLPVHAWRTAHFTF